jgi:hypothetical protein
MDDLAIIAKDPREIVDVLEWKYKFKLKGTGLISFHLGMGFFCDEEGVLCLSPKKHYIERMISTYSMFNNFWPRFCNKKNPINFCPFLTCVSVLES